MAVVNVFFDMRAQARDPPPNSQASLFQVGPVKEYPRGSLAQNDLHRKFLIERYIHAWQTSMRVFSCKLSGSTLELTQLDIKPVVCILEELWAPTPVFRSSATSSEIALSCEIGSVTMT